MIGRQYFKVAGTGSYLPTTVVSAEEIDSRVGKPIGWTRRRVGVLTRHESPDRADLTAMAGRAIEAAMTDAGIGWKHIDLVLDCSTTRCRPIPNNASHWLQTAGQLAAAIPGMDVQSTCLGFLTALNVVNGLFASGMPYRRVLIVAAEQTMAGVNWTDAESAALVGDGAAAAIVENVGEVGPLVLAHETFAQHLNLCCVDGGGHLLPFYEYDASRKGEFLFAMDGKQVFRLALQRLPPMVERFVGEATAAGLGDRDQWQVLPHQASPKALKLMRLALGFSSEQFHCRVAQLGNMAAASMPFMLDWARREGQVQSGGTVMLLGTSAGYSQAAMAFRL